MDPRTSLHHRIFSGLCMMLAFFLTFTVRLLPLIIALMVVNWLLEPGYKTRFRAVFHDRKRLLTLCFPILYLLYLLSMFYSEDTEYGWFDLEIKLSMFIFPVLVATSGVTILNRTMFEKILVMFVAGTVTGALLFFSHSVYLSYTTLLLHPFFYGNLSWYMHASYLSMYSCFAIAAIACLFVRKNHTLRSTTRMVMAVMAMMLTIFIILLSSRIGILMLILLGLGIAVFVIFRLKRPLAGIGFITGFTALMLIFSMLFPFPMGRFISAKQSVEGMDKRVTGQNTEAAATRLIVWKSAIELIRMHLLTGVGVGDVKDEMMKKYQKNNLQQAFDQKLNCHNQYLQTAVALGVPGMLVLILVLLIPAVFALKRNFYFYFVFLVIMALNMIFESMMEIQAGTIFYGFLNTILFWYGINHDMLHQDLPAEGIPV